MSMLLAIFGIRGADVAVELGQLTMEGDGKIIINSLNILTLKLK
jgi:hypothetical protein